MTKAEKKQKEALRIRVADIVSGACGRDMDTNDDWVTLSEVGGAIVALKERLLQPHFRLEDKEIPDHMMSPHNLDHYENIDSLTDFYWEQGVRV